MKKTREIAQCSVFIALALVLSYIERFIPLQMFVPLPGIKLGLANIVTLIALYLLGTGNAVTILILRCILGSVFGGGITGLMFSITGGIFSVAVMSMACRVQCFSIYGVSILGAAAHNVGQICAAMVLMQSVYIVGYLPYLLLAALVTGFATGSAAAGLLKVLPSGLQESLCLGN